MSGEWLFCRVWSPACGVVREPEPCQRWRLAERRLLNPGNQGGPMSQLSLTFLTGFMQWQPRDKAVRNAIGDTRTDRLIDEGHYRRDLS